MKYLKGILLAAMFAISAMADKVQIGVTSPRDFYEGDAIIKLGVVDEIDESRQDEKHYPWHQKATAWFAYYIKYADAPDENATTEFVFDAELTVEEDANYMKNFRTDNSSFSGSQKRIIEKRSVSCSILGRKIIIGYCLDSEEMPPGGFYTAKLTLIPRSPKVFVVENNLEAFCFLGRVLPEAEVHVASADPNTKEITLAWNVHEGSQKDFDNAKWQVKENDLRCRIWCSSPEYADGYGDFTNSVPLSDSNGQPLEYPFADRKCTIDCSDRKSCRPVNYWIEVVGDGGQRRAGDNKHPYLRPHYPVTTHRRRALAVGVDTYSTEAWERYFREQGVSDNVPTAKNHNRTESNFFKTTLFGAYPEDWAQWLVGSDCTVENVCDAIVGLAEDSRNLWPGDEVYLYFSTHGRLLASGNGNDFALDMYDGPMESEALTSAVSKFKDKGVRVIGIVNSCHSGGIIKSFDTKEFNFSGWIASTKMDERAFSNDEGTSGFGDVFLKWGWNEGYAKLDFVTQRDGTRAEASVTPRSRYLMFNEIAQYAGLLFPGISPQTYKMKLGGADNESSITISNEQHVQMVNEDLLKGVCAKEFEKTPTSEGNGSAGPSIEEVLDSTSQRQTLRVKGASSGEWHVLEFTRKDNGAKEWMVVQGGANGLYTEKQWQTIFPGKSSSASLYPLLVAGKSYDVSARVLRAEGWSKQGEHYLFKVMDDGEWIARISQKTSLSAHVDGHLGGKVFSVDVKTSVGVHHPQPSVDLSLAETSDSSLSIYYVNGSSMEYGTVDEDNGTLKADFGTVWVNSIGSGYSVTRVASGNMTLTISKDGAELRIGSLSFKGRVWCTKEIESYSGVDFPLVDDSPGDDAVVPGDMTNLFSSFGLANGTVYILNAGIPPDMEEMFAVISGGGWKLSVSGLPSGIRYDAKNGVLTGIASKEGESKVTFTATKKGEAKQTATATFKVVFPTLMLSAAPCGDESATGTVSGGGRFPSGKKVPIKATPAKGCVFAGWFGSWQSALPYEDDFRLYSQSASTTFRTGSSDASLTAVFATTAEDKASLKVVVSDQKTGADGAYMFNLGNCVESITPPKLAVTGLPQGLKYDVKTFSISGKAKKPGVYTVKVSATNTSVKKATEDSTGEFTLTVPNFTCGALPNLKPETDAYDPVMSGVLYAADRIDCTPANGWTVKVTGLPSGLKYDAKAGRITGVPTAKEGSYTVTFTASKKGEPNQISTITLNVASLPAWASGTFNGTVDAGGLVPSLTVSAAGAISGKLLDGGKTWTLSAKSFDGYDESADAYVATVVGKSGKETFSNEVAFVAEKIGEDMRGVATGGGWTAWQNLWKTEPWKTLAKSFTKAPALAVGEVTLKFAASGAVTASGKFVIGKNAKGTDVIYSATCSSVLVPKASGTDAAGDTANYQLYLYFPPKDGKFKGYAAEISLTWDGAAFALAE